MKLGYRGVQLRPAGFFVLRVPALPIVAFTKLMDQVQPTATDAPGIVAEATGIRDVLLSVARQSLLRNAIEVATDDFSERFEAWCANPSRPDADKIQRTVLKYLSRMSTRCTPFGLCSMVAVGEIAEASALALASTDTARLHTRLDAALVRALAREAARGEVTADWLKYRPNDTLVRSGDHYRYHVPRLASELKGFDLAESLATSELSAVLSRAVTGATFGELVSVLANDEIAVDDAAEFINTLISESVLISDLDPSITGADPMSALAARCLQVPARHSIGRAMRDIRESVTRIVDPISDSISVQQETIRRQLKEVVPDAPDKNLLHVDAYLCDRPHLGRAIVDEIRKGVATAYDICAYRDDPLRDFATEFEARYDRRAVPLLEALDEQGGLGFPLLTRRDAQATEPTLLPVPERSRRSRVLLRILNVAVANRLRAVELSSVDVEGLSLAQPLPLPTSLSAVVSLFAKSSADLERHEFCVHLRGVSGPSGANLMGRFCHGHPALPELVSEYLREEERLAPDVQFAEIVHDAHDRLGNILNRPHCREWEIEVFGRSEVQDGHCLRLSDLILVVRGGLLQLWSRRLRKRIMPRLTSAHNYSHRTSLPVYRFLGLLQRHGVTTGMGWSWDEQYQAPFLPRVHYGRLVLAWASWLVTLDEYKACFEKGGSTVKAVTDWRAQRGIPRFATLRTGEDGLTLDFANPLCCDIMRAELRRYGELRLEEFPYEELTSATTAGGAPVANELIVPFTVDRIDRSRRAARDSTERFVAPRTTDQLRPWVFLKLYTGPREADRLIAGELRALVESLRLRELIDLAFFVRYADPQPHLRIRVRVSPSQERSAALDAMQSVAERLLEAGLVWRACLDTYQREVERYGGEAALARCEELFDHDSDLAARVIAACDGEAGTRVRWLVAMASVDHTLDAFGFTIAERLAVARDVCKGDRARRPQVRAQAQKLFREHREQMDPILTSTRYDTLDPRLAEALRALCERDERDRLAITALRKMSAEGTLDVDLSTLATTLGHMSVNRLLREDHADAEVLVYDSLRRYYDRMVSRSDSTT